MPTGQKAKNPRPKKGGKSAGLGTWTATAYGPPWGGINGAGEATACGVKLDGGAPEFFAVAAPSSLPCGTVLRIQPNPFGTNSNFVVWDRGGAIVGKRLDFYDWRGRESQLQWGSRKVQVTRIGKLPMDQVRTLVQAGGAKDAGDLIKGGNKSLFDKGGDLIDDTGEALAAIVKFIARLFEPSFWVRVGKAVLGAIALIIGVAILGRALLGVDLPAYGERVARGAVQGADKRSARRSGIDRQRDKINRNRGWQSPPDEVPF